MDQRVLVNTKTCLRNFTYRGVNVLTLTMSYPQINYPCDARVQAVNDAICSEVIDYRNHVCTDLYRNAVEAYRYDRQNQFPFAPFDAVLNYTVTWNQDCLISMYRDQYEFTGGAHGNTLRFADTFSLRTGTRLPLSAFFPAGVDYQTLLIKLIIQQADANMQQNPGIYFPNYRDLIVQYFNPQNFYLSPEGLNIFYQQYELGPYVTGIVVFTIPYSQLAQVSAENSANAGGACTQ